MPVRPAQIALVLDDAGIEPAEWQQALDGARVEPGTRSLRLPVRDLTSELSGAGVLLGFTLDRGSFAMSVLRELCDAPACLVACN
ncbi:MAG: tRNA pseudouridine(13) synthase TruD [Chromatocurvus sp.]